MSESPYPQFGVVFFLSGYDSTQYTPLVAENFKKNMTLQNVVYNRIKDKVHHDSAKESEKAINVIALSYPIVID